MKKSSKVYYILSIISLIFIPIIFAVLTAPIISANRFDYNRTLLNGIESNDSEIKDRCVLSFDGEERNSMKGWDKYTAVFNKDFSYLSSTTFRTSKFAFDLFSSEDNKTSVILSDIRFFDETNKNNNQSCLFITSPSDEFSDNSIYLSNVLANDLSAAVDDEVILISNNQEYKLKVVGIYKSDDNANRYLNNVYLEFDNPVCFISQQLFTTLSNNSYNSFVSVRSKITDNIDSLYNELNPLLTINDSRLVVTKNFSVNDFSINNQSLKAYQSNLLSLYEQNNMTNYYISMVSVIIIVINLSIVGFVCFGKLISTYRFVFRHFVLFDFIYSLYVIGISLLTALILRSDYLKFTIDNYKVYRSLKAPLIFITITVIAYLFVIIVASCFYHQKKKKDVCIDRKKQIDKLNAKSNKVIFVTGSLSRGGAEKVIVELANYYASLGKEVDIVILLNNVIGWDLHKNINVVNFTGNTNSRIKRIGYWIKNLKQYFDENKNAPIVSFLVRVNILVLLTAKKEDHYIIISERNDPRYDGRGIIVSSFVNALYPKADKIVFQTKECKELFSKDIQELGVIIPNPIKIKKYASISKYRKNYFVSAGRITEQKDQIIMILAISLIIKEHKDVILEIYGDGDLAIKLNKSIKKYKLQDNVFILPNTKDINEKILSSTAYICTSLYEGMSNSLMEASFAGVPCITTPCLGTDFIHNKKNGYIIDFESPKDLASKMRLILDNEENYNNLRKESIKIAKDLKHEDVYNKWKECIDNE